MKRITLILLCNLLLTLYLPAEEGILKFEHISSEDGLSQNTVTAIIQDQKGFMWFATQEGLNRYDGYEFKIYGHEPDNPNSLSHDVLTCLLEDRRGKLWIGTLNGGLNRFDPLTGTFTRYQMNPQTPNSLSHNYVRCIMEDSSGWLWIGTEGGGLNVLILPVDPGKEEKISWAPENIRFIPFQYHPHDPSSLSHNIVSVIYEDKNKDIWIGTEGGGLNKVIREPGSNNPNKKKDVQLRLTFKHYTHDPRNPESLSDNSVRAISQDSPGALWIGTKRGGLNCFDRQGETFTHYKNIPGDPTSLSHNNVSAIVEDREGFLWIGTFGGGLNSLQPQQDQVKGKLKFNRYQYNINNPYSLSESVIWSLYVDVQGTLWIGMADIGLNKFDRKRYKFKHYTVTPYETGVLNNPTVRAIFQDSRGLLWIGTHGGLTCLDRDTGTFTHFRGSEQDADSLSDNVVRSIYEDREGRLWVGTHDGGLNQLIRKNRPGKTGIPIIKFLHYRAQAGSTNSLSHDEVVVIGEDRFGVLWIGTNGGGLNQFFPAAGIFVHYKSDANHPNSLSSNFVRAIYEDLSGTLWIGTNGGGLNRFNREKRNFTVFQHDDNNPNSLSSNYIFSLYESPAAPGVLWIGTYGGGLNKFNVKTGTFVNYRKEDGLPNNVIYGILEASIPAPAGDSSSTNNMGNLWLSTNKGLCQFNPVIGVVENYGQGDGLQGDEFIAGAFHKNKQGEMFFGGVNGFNIFYPSAVEPNRHMPPIVITDFKIFHQSIKTLPVALGDLKEIRLKHYENFFSFKFSALDYTDPSKNKYQYRLQGVDKNWIFCDADNRQANYTNISPGTYIFQVRGSNNDEIWNLEGTSIKTVITPPFWGTWWFRALCLLIIMVSLMFLVKRWINKIKYQSGQEQLNLKQEMEKRELEQELKLKADFTAMLVHDLRSPLTAVLGYAEMLKTNPRQLDIARTGEILSQSSQQMLNLINDMLDISKIEAGKMTLKKSGVSLQRMAADVMDLMKPLLTKKKLNIRYNFAELEDIVLDREKIDQVINNLVSNALKFSPPGSTISLQTSLVTVKGCFFQEFSITDEGPGIPGEHRRYLFDKYAQLHQNVSFRGTGLGLAVSRVIIEAHGGEIGYRPGEYGGSIFFFRLPEVTNNDHE
jgi:two-component system sensor histidine kinase ChiS